MAATLIYGNMPLQLNVQTLNSLKTCHYIVCTPMSNKSKNKYPMVYIIIVFYQSNFALLKFSAFLDRNQKPFSIQSYFDITRKLLNQGFLLVKLKSSLRKLYGRHHDLVDRYGISVSKMTTDMFHLS